MNITKENLINLAQDNGFISILPMSAVINDVKYYNLWLSELQAALRDGKLYDKWIVQVVQQEGEYFAQYKFPTKEYRYTSMFEFYEDALQEGLIKTLKIWT